MNVTKGGSSHSQNGLTLEGRASRAAKSRRIVESVY